MHTVSSTHFGKFQSRGSDFLAFLTPFSSFQSLLSTLKQEHRKASHFVYASRWQETQMMESFSDDGEPRGSSGVPTLNVLRGEDLMNVGLITVRYFGGTLLGVGGLVRAYTQAAQEAIKDAKNKNDFLIYETRIQYSFLIPYSLLRQVEYLLSESKIQVLEKTFLPEGGKFLLSSTEERQKEFQKVCRAKFGLS